MSEPRLSSEERRKQIVENAGKVFSKVGLDGARTKDIAKACGINEAIIYRHFSGKKELFTEFMAFNYARISRRWNELAEEAPNGLEVLRAVLNAQLDKADSENTGGAMLQCVASSSGEKDLRDIIRAYYLDQHKSISRLIERGIRDGSIRTDIDVTAAAWIFRCIVWGQIMFSIMGLTPIVPGTNARKSVMELIDHLNSSKKERPIFSRPDATI